jgi:hypothetical protein
VYIGCLLIKIDSRIERAGLLYNICPYGESYQLMTINAIYSKHVGARGPGATSLT